MKTYEEIDEPKGQTLTFDYIYNTQDDFLNHLGNVFMKELIDYGCGLLNHDATLYYPTEDREYFILEMKGDGMRETDVFFMVYEEEDKVSVEWKFNPIQTGYLIKVKPIFSDGSGINEYIQQQREKGNDDPNDEYYPFN